MWLRRYWCLLQLLLMSIDAMPDGWDESKNWPNGFCFCNVSRSTFSNFTGVEWTVDWRHRERRKTGIRFLQNYWSLHNTEDANYELRTPGFTLFFSITEARWRKFYLDTSCTIHNVCSRMQIPLPATTTVALTYCTSTTDIHNQSIHPYSIGKE